jgi:hypothetical protein
MDSLSRRWPNAWAKCDVCRSIKRANVGVLSLCPPSFRAALAVPEGFYWWLKARTAAIEVVVSPGVPLDDQMALLIAISAPELNGYFSQTGGG